VRHEFHEFAKVSRAKARFGVRRLDAAFLPLPAVYYVGSTALIRNELYAP
jgi:hypothetical protein